MKIRILRADADKGGSGAPPDDTSKPGGSAPASVAAVKKTPLKTPREIELEKQNARLEKRIDDIDGEVAGIRSFLEGLELGGPKPVPVKKASATPPVAPANGFWSDVNRDLYGGT